MEAIPARRAFSKVDFLIFVPLPPDKSISSPQVPATRPVEGKLPLRALAWCFLNWKQVAAWKLSVRESANIAVGSRLEGH